jgi:hypothetical protein
MRKTRVELSYGLFATIILITAFISCLILSGTSQYVPRSSDYSTYDFAVNPPMPDFYYPLANYTLVRSGTSIGLFNRIGLEKFESGIEFSEGLTNITHIDDFGILGIHETPTAVIRYSATQQNTMKFELVEGTGAIKRGSSVVVGSEKASGIFLLQGDSIASISGQDVLFNIPAGSGVIFRTDTGLDNPVGNAVAGGRVSAEMYLLDAGWTIAEDIVSYDNTWLYTVTASEELVEVQVSGESAAGKAVVIHVTEPYLKYSSADDLVVKLDDKLVKIGAGMTETLWEDGQESRYFAVKTAEGFDVVVYMPENSDSVITITTAEADFGVDGIITLLAAIGIVAVAVVALIKTD